MLGSVRVAGPLPIVRNRPDGCRIAQSCGPCPPRGASAAGARRGGSRREPATTSLGELTELACVADWSEKDGVLVAVGIVQLGCCWSRNCGHHRTGARPPSGVVGCLGECSRMTLEPTRRAVYDLGRSVVAPNLWRSSAARIWLRNSAPIRLPLGNWSSRSQRQLATIANIKIRHSHSRS